MQAKRMVETRNPPFPNLITCLDSEVAIKAQRFHLVKSKGVRQKLYGLSTPYTCVPGHCGIEISEKADELARKNIKNMSPT